MAEQRNRNGAVLLIDGMCAAMAKGISMLAGEIGLPDDLCEA
jgi:hypothetical protein